MLEALLSLLDTHPAIVLAAVTLIPFFELRASIPLGIFKTDLHWSAVFAVCVLANVLLGPILYFLLDSLTQKLLKFRVFAGPYNYYVEKTQRKIHRYVEKYGELGVALFIAIPLPGSGSYSGALGSYLIGLGHKRFIIANTVGVTLAGVLVTVLSIVGGEAAKSLIKII